MNEIPCCPDNASSSVLAQKFGLSTPAADQESTISTRRPPMRRPVHPGEFPRFAKLALARGKNITEARLAYREALAAYSRY